MSPYTFIIRSMLDLSKFPYRNLERHPTDRANVADPSERFGGEPE